MVKLAALSIAELDLALAASQPSGRSDLRDLHLLLTRATPLATDPPRSSLATAARLAAALPSSAADSLPPRPRTVFRLLRAGALDAAWAVLIDNASGVVEEPARASTSSGSPRATWRLPLLTKVEAPQVFADLPGFRDPRYDAPDDCYDITGRLSLHHGLDGLEIADSVIRVGGWASIDPLPTGPHEQIRLVVSNDDDELSINGRRIRRPDLVAGGGQPAQRQAWAGWVVELDPASDRLQPGESSLAIELEHDGVVRRSSVGGDAGEVSKLARAAASGVMTIGPRAIRWRPDRAGWRLVIE
jgi:hypothetical protein